MYMKMYVGTLQARPVLKELASQTGKPAGHVRNPASLTNQVVCPSYGITFGWIG